MTGNHLGMAITPEEYKRIVDALEEQTLLARERWYLLGTAAWALSIAYKELLAESRDPVMIKVVRDEMQAAHDYCRKGTKK